MGLHVTKKLLHSKGNSHQTEKDGVGGRGGGGGRGEKGPKHCK
jgi:hypothetical protein